MKRWFIAVVALQICFILGEALHYRSQLDRGRTVSLEVVPVDPKSLFEGHYMALGYKITRWKDLAPYCPVQGKALRPGDTVWVGLKPHKPTAVVMSVSLQEPPREPGIVYLKGVYRDFWDSGMITYGIERYYIPETRQKDAEKLWNRVLVKKSLVTAEISVDNHGRGLVKGLYENGVPLGY